MVRSLRQRVALAVLLGVLLVPVVMSSLGGIGQLLVCEATVAQPFAVAPGGQDGPLVTSSRTLDRDASDTPRFEGTDEAAALCGGVSAEIAAEIVDPDTVRLVVTLVNSSELPWQGSIGVTADAGDVDVDLTTSLGEVPAGGRRSDTLLLSVQDTQADIGGRILLGP